MVGGSTTGLAAEAPRQASLAARQSDTFPSDPLSVGRTKAGASTATSRSGFFLLPARMRAGLPLPPAQLKSGLSIAVYILLSGGQIFFNKWILSSRHFNFPFPVSLTLLHMLFSSMLCFLLFKVFKLRTLQSEMTYHTYTRAILPISLMFALTLWFGNTAYLHISVSFAQMLKAIMPAAVFLIGVACRIEPPSLPLFLIMCVISGGVLISALGEVRFNWTGVVCQLAGVAGEAGRLVLVELLLKRRGVNMDPLAMMWHVSPCSAACLFLPWLFLEQPTLRRRAMQALAAAAAANTDTTSSSSIDTLTLLSSSLFSVDPLSLLSSHAYPLLVMTLNALCTFALNVSVFLVILHTSALTIRVAGVVKDWLVVLVSALLFADTKLTTVNLFGYAVAIGGVGLYHRYRATHPNHLPTDKQHETEGQDLLQIDTDEEEAGPELVPMPRHKQNTS